MTGTPGGAGLGTTVGSRAYRFLLLHPVRFVRRLLSEHATPPSLAAAAALGVAVGSTPLFGLHTVLVYVLARRWRLNRLVALGTNQLCMPPFVPALCIEIGYYLRHGAFLTEISLHTLGRQAGHRMWEWAIGSLVVGPVLGFAAGAVMWGFAVAVGRRHRRVEPAVQLLGGGKHQEAAPAGQPRATGTASPAPAPVAGAIPEKGISAPL